MAIGINWKEIWKPVWKPVWKTTATTTRRDTDGIRRRAAAKQQQDLELEYLAYEERDVRDVVMVLFATRIIE